MSGFLTNPLLETRAPTGWQGCPLDAKGRFQNLNHPFWPEFSKLWRWQTTTNPQKKEKKLDNWLPEILADGDFLNRKDDCLVWLGHASFFIRLHGIGFLIDPVMGKASVVKRHVPFPYPASIAKAASYLLISHDHRDHLDTPSLKKMAQENPNMKVLTGLGMKKLLQSCLGGMEIEEAAWYQKFTLCREFPVWFLPNRHWSRRSLNDTNERLWGGFLLEAPGQPLYFMSDSGYDSHFADIGNLFPGIRLAIMGIGAYSPEWFMHPSHMKPEDSWKAFLDLKAEQMVPMHFGTFDLADEPLREPLVRLKACAEASKIVHPFIGQTHWL